MRASFVVWILCGGCSGVVAPAPTQNVDGGVVAEASVDAPAVVTNPAAGCATSFGTGLTNAFGKLDGFVTAIVRHEDTQCAEGTSANHVVVQVKSQGAVYRMVVAIESSRGADLDVRFASVTHSAFSPWLEAWHAPASLDYATMLDVHSGATFAPVKRDRLVAELVAAMPIGSKVSVYATSSGGASAHLVHKNAPGADGAIVVDPEGASPRWLLFHYADQMF